MTAPVPGINNSEIAIAARAAVQAFDSQSDPAMQAIFYAFRAFADNIDNTPTSAPKPWGEAPWPYNEPLTPTSELLNRAARMINDLMIGRGVDRRNGLQWQVFVRELYDRAAAFKACEEEGRK